MLRTLRPSTQHLFRFSHCHHPVISRSAPRCVCSHSTPPSISISFRRHVSTSTSTSTSPSSTPIAPPTQRVGQPLHHTHPHLIGAGELTPGIPATEYSLRRRRIYDEMLADSIFIVPSNPQAYYQHDVYHNFRQNADLTWLTGFLEPHSVFVMIKPAETIDNTSTSSSTSTSTSTSTSDRGPEFIMFVQPSDPVRIRWDGPRAGIDGVCTFFGATHAYDIATLGTHLPSLMASVTHVYYHDTKKPKPVHSVMDAYIWKMRDDHARHTQLHSSLTLLESHRLIKSSAEIAVMQRSARASALTYVDMMRETIPMISEMTLAILFESRVKQRGATRLAYPCVIASGDNARTLHYVSNDCIIRSGSLILADCGGDYGCYMSDITRTWPANGTFTQPQRDIYQLVLDVQKKCIQLCVANGSTRIASINHECKQWLLQGLRTLGIVPPATTSPTSTTPPTTTTTSPSTSTTISASNAHDESESNIIKRFYPHSVGHYLGLDVHDTNTITSTTILQPGMVITIEPGLYIPHDDDIPQQYRGIGIRIEDDVVITTGAPIVLTRDALKEIDEIEAIMRTARPPPSNS